jgi:quercetin dioxygenase-like cupin family protein
MKRRNFLLGLATAGPALTSFPTKAGSLNPAKGFKAAAGEGRIHGHIQLKGINANILDVKVSGRDTDGALAIFEQTSLSPRRGTPLHLHHSQDEVFYVLEGEYYFQVGADKHRLKAGDSIFLPRKVPHAWTQVSEKGKMTVVLQPAGKLEEFFVTIAALKQEPTPAEIARIFANHDMQVLGPPLAID